MVENSVSNFQGSQLLKCCMTKESFQHGTRISCVRSSVNRSCQFTCTEKTSTDDFLNSSHRSNILVEKYTIARKYLWGKHSLSLLQLESFSKTMIRVCY